VFRATPTERARYRAAAERAGLTVGSLCRASLDASPITRGQRRPTIDQVIAAKFLREANRSGAHLYQLVRGLNFDTFPQGDELRAALVEAAEECRKAQAACRALLQGLSR
jgi:hypothetical protein